MPLPQLHSSSRSWLDQFDGRSTRAIQLLGFAPSSIIRLRKASQMADGAPARHCQALFDPVAFLMFPGLLAA